MLAGAFSCHHLKAHRSDEYIVPEASDGDVTDTACPGRIPLVEQQVSLPLLLIKTETDTQATFTSHQGRSPQSHKITDARHHLRPIPDRLDSCAARRRGSRSVRRPPRLGEATPAVSA